MGSYNPLSLVSKPTSLQRRVIISLGVFFVFLLGWESNNILFLSEEAQSCKTNIISQQPSPYSQSIPTHDIPPQKNIDPSLLATILKKLNHTDKYEHSPLLAIPPSHMEIEYELILNGSLEIDRYWETLVREIREEERPHLPGIIVIGTMKSGTTSLHSLFMQHPQVSSPDPLQRYNKEAHFYDTPGVYNSVTRYLTLWPQKDSRIREEATPAYLFFPLTPYRMKHIYGNTTHNFPDSKYLSHEVNVTWPRLIVILRNPVDRAYSQCRHFWGSKCTPSLFDKMIKEGISSYEKFRMGWNSTAEVFPHYLLRSISAWRIHTNAKRTLTMNHPLKAKFDEATVFHDRFHDMHEKWSPELILRGFYSTQLRWWFKVYPPQSFFIMETKDIGETEHLQSTMDKLIEWLGLSQFNFAFTKENHNTFVKELPMLDSTREILESYFAHHNEDLENLLGRQFSWTKR